jgi:hypothetical protein
LVRTFEWLTLLPLTGALPQISQRCANVESFIALVPWSPARFGVCGVGPRTVTFQFGGGF